MADVVLKNAAGENVTYVGVNTVRLAKNGGGTVDFGTGGGTQYVSGSVTEVTLEASGWNGTTFVKTLTYTDPTDPVYTTGLQIGIPPTSSAANAEALRAAGITLPQATKSTSTSESEGVTTTTVTVTLTFSAIYTPSADVRIAVYGLRGWAT